MTKQKNEPVEYDNFLLFNLEKLDRVFNGITVKGGGLEGGLGKDAPIKDILALYDKYGGLIKTKDGKKVETGSFWDFEKGIARQEPLVVMAKEPARGGELVQEIIEGTPKRGRPKKQIEE